MRRDWGSQGCPATGDSAAAPAPGWAATVLARVGPARLPPAIAQVATSQVRRRRFIDGD
jgi:hypothetical protein